MFRRRKKNFSLEEKLLRQGRNVGLVFSKVRVNYKEKTIIFTNYDSSVYVPEKQLFDRKFFIKARSVVESCLPKEYRLKPQLDVFLNSKNELVLFFESTDSKQLLEVPRSLETNTIMLMKGSSWKYNQQPHALITGVTGSGKSYLLNYLISCFLKLNGEIYIIDPKVSDLASLGKSYLPRSNCATVAEDAIELLERLVSIMNKRQETISTFGELGSDAYKLGFRPIVLFYDELAALAAEIGSDKKQKATYDLLLKKLILKGRSAGITVILTMQKPLSTNLPTEIRDQCSLRIVLGRNTSKDTRKLVFGINESQNAILSSDYMVCDEWLETEVKKFGGWYSLPEMKEPFSLFESPELSNFDFQQEIIQPLKRNYFGNEHL